MTHGVAASGPPSPAPGVSDLAPHPDYNRIPLDPSPANCFTLAKNLRMGDFPVVKPRPPALTSAPPAGATLM
jgi:hypothetical protein